MPARSTISQLPSEIRAELDKRLVAGRFSDYAGLAAWLKKKGVEISRSAAHRYGQKFEARLTAIKAATDQARAISEAVDDDPGRMGKALTRLCQEKAFNTLMDMNDAGDLNLAALGRMVADLNRSEITQERWRAEVKEKARQAVENIEERGKAKGLKPEAMQIIKEEIYGITGK